MTKELSPSKVDKIKQWQQSGLSKTKWCQQNNIVYQTFHNWHSRYQKQNTSGDSFMQLKVDTFSTAAYSEVVLTDGKRIIFYQPVSVDYLKAIIN